MSSPRATSVAMFRLTSSIPSETWYCNSRYRTGMFGEDRCSGGKSLVKSDSGRAIGSGAGGRRKLVKRDDSVGVSSIL